MRLFKWQTLLISVIVILIMPALACVQAPAPTATQALPAKTLKFKMVDWLTPAHWTRPLWLDFFSRVKERSGGRLEISIVDASAAGLKWGDTLPTLKDGVYEMNNACSFYMAGEGKLFNLGWVPMLLEGVEELAMARYVMTDIYQKELDKWGTSILAFVPFEAQVPGATKPITKVADYKGLRLRALGTESSKLAIALGATPVSMPISDAYMSLQKGLLDGFVGMGMSGWRTYSFSEVVPFITDFSVGAGDGFLLISKKHYDALPADVKAILLEEAVKFENKAWKGIRDLEVATRAYVKEKGVKVVTPTEELKAELRRVSVPIIDAWAADVGSSGMEAVKSIRAILHK